jgi:hypothetical protein
VNTSRSASFTHRKESQIPVGWIPFFGTDVPCREQNIVCSQWFSYVSRLVHLDQGNDSSVGWHLLICADIIIAKVVTKTKAQKQEVIGFQETRRRTYCHNEICKNKQTNYAWKSAKVVTDHCSTSRGSSVGIATGHGLDPRGIGVQFPAGTRNVFFSTAPRQALQPTQPPIQ